MTKYKSALLAIHSAVILFALSGLFGKWLTLPASTIVFGRAIFAAGAIYLFVILVAKKSLKVSAKLLLLFSITGLILAVHWVSFFAAIQASNVTIGLITFATFPLFTSLVEPLFFKERYHVVAFIQALITMFGIALVLPEIDVKSEQITGALLGVFSAFSFAILTVLNRKFVADVNALTVSFYQNLFAGLFLLPIAIFVTSDLSLTQLSMLMLLGLVFTALSHSLFNYSLTKIKAQAVSIAVTLEPIYGIIAAVILLNESLTPMMILGGGLVLGANYWSSKTSHQLK